MRRGIGRSAIMNGRVFLVARQHAAAFYPLMERGRGIRTRRHDVRVIPPSPVRGDLFAVPNRKIIFSSSVRSGIFGLWPISARKFLILSKSDPPNMPPLRGFLVLKGVVLQIGRAYGAAMPRLVVPPPRLNEARNRAIGHYEWMGVSGGPATRRRFLSADGGGKACRSALA